MRRYVWTKVRMSWMVKEALDRDEGRVDEEGGLRLEEREGRWNGN
jgi:hypothetical protein